VDLFEILLIAVFLVFPLLEHLLKRGKGKGQLPQSELPSEGDGSEAAEPEDARVSAADMLPDDLWAVLTGESRGRSGGVATAKTEPVDESSLDPAPWSDDEVGSASGPWDESSSWEQGMAREPAPEPVSLEYRGPEAYSLEDVDIEPVSLERPLPTPEARHRAFHKLVDRPPGRRRRRRSPLVRALANPDSVRQAVVLSEILGPPKGLD
jgi:hypothetical protein